MITNSHNMNLNSNYYFKGEIIKDIYLSFMYRSNNIYILLLLPKEYKLIFKVVLNKI